MSRAPNKHFLRISGGYSFSLSTFVGYESKHSHFQDSSGRLVGLAFSWWMFWGQFALYLGTSSVFHSIRLLQ